MADAAYADKPLRSADTPSVDVFTDAHAEALLGVFGGTDANASATDADADIAHQKEHDLLDVFKDDSPAKMSISDPEQYVEEMADAVVEEWTRQEIGRGDVVSLDSQGLGAADWDIEHEDAGSASDGSEVEDEAEYRPEDQVQLPHDREVHTEQGPNRESRTPTDNNADNLKSQIEASSQISQHGVLPDAMEHLVDGDEDDASDEEKLDGPGLDDSSQADSDMESGLASESVEQGDGVLDRARDLFEGLQNIQVVDEEAGDPDVQYEDDNSSVEEDAVENIPDVVATVSSNTDSRNEDPEAASGTEEFHAEFEAAMSSDAGMHAIHDVAEESSGHREEEAGGDLGGRSGSFDEEENADGASTNPIASLEELQSLNARLVRELEQARQEINSLEASSDQFRCQLKQAREQQRVLAEESTSDKQAFLAAVDREKNALSVLSDAQGQTEQLLAALQAREEDLRELKLAQAELPARILRQQAELEEERKRFKLLTDRFNRVKELEMHRLRQRFMEVSRRQKEVFDRLKERYLGIQVAFKEEQARGRLQHDHLKVAKSRLDSAHAEIAQLKKRWGDLGHDNATLEKRFEEERARLATDLAASQAQLADVVSQLADAKAAAEAKLREEEEQSKMVLYFECVNDDAPELGNELRAKTHRCGDVLDFSWWRSFHGSRFVGMQGTPHDVYVLTADDIGACLRTRCVNGANLSAQAEIGPVRVSEDVACTLHDLLTSKKDVAFSVRPDDPEDSKGGQGATTIVLTKDKLKLRNGRRTQVKEVFSSAVKVDLDPFDELQMRVTFNATTKPITVFTQTSAMRDLIAITIRCYKLLHQTHTTYKEKEANMLLLQFLITTSNVDSMKSFDMSGAKSTRKISNTVGKRSFSMGRSLMLVVPNQAELNPRRSRSSRLEEPSVSESIGPVIADASAHSVARSSQKSLQQSVSQKSPEPVRTDSVTYDAEGFIIREETFITNPFGTHEDDADRLSDDDDEMLPSPVIEPIVIKPKEEAVEATEEELSRAMIGIARPPPSSSSKKGAVRAKTEKIRKKKRRKKAGKHAHTTSESSDIVGTIPVSELTSFKSRAAVTEVPQELGASPQSAATIMVVEEDPVGVQHVPAAPAPRTTVSASVIETLSCSMTDGIMHNISVVGTVCMVMSPPLEMDLVVPFSLADTDLIDEVVCNGKVVDEVDEVSYQAHVSRGLDSLPVLRYSLQLGEEAAPLSVYVQCEHGADASVDLVIACEQMAEAPRLTSISLLVGLTGGVAALESSSPACMYDPEQQRVCWKQVAFQTPVRARLRPRGDASAVQVASCIAQFVCASDSLSGAIVLIEPDPQQRYSRADNTVQVASRPFKVV